MPHPISSREHFPLVDRANKAKQLILGLDALNKAEEQIELLIKDNNRLKLELSDNQRELVRLQEYERQMSIGANDLNDDLTGLKLETIGSVDHYKEAMPETADFNPNAGEDEFDPTEVED